MAWDETLALIDGYLSDNGDAVPASLASTLSNSSQGPVNRLCYSIRALCAAHAGQVDPLRAATRTLAEQLIAYAQPYAFFSLDYPSLLAQLAADDAATST